MSALWAIWSSFFIGIIASAIALRLTLTVRGWPLPRAGSVSILSSAAVMGVVAIAVSLSQGNLALLAPILTTGVSAAFLFVATVFLSRTSIRVARLRSVGREDIEITPMPVSTGAAAADLDVRIARLLESGYLVVVSEDHVFAPPSPARFYAHAIGRLRAFFSVKG